LHTDGKAPSIDGASDGGRSSGTKHAGWQSSPAVPAPLGAAVHPGGVEFGVYATTAARCQVRIFGEDRSPLGEHDLPGHGAGFFRALVPGLGPGTLYKFVLDGRELPDPYARFLPDGVHGPAMVVASTYRWKNGPGIARPLRELVIYELHVGTFTEEGTYAAAADRLPYLADLGVTALELMPLAAFAGRRGWGYDGVAPYAPFAPYGTPDELRAFVDRAHDLGISVLLDAVYNHFGPAGNYLAAYAPEYFTSKLHNAWGDALDYTNPVVRRLVIESALYWLEELRFDGLRLDAVHAISDPSPRHVVHELAERVRALSPAKILIAEDERNEPALVEEMGLQAIWADDFHHAVHVTLTGEQDGYYAGYRPQAQTVADAIAAGWLYTGQTYPSSGKPRGRPAPGLPAQAFVYCLQNHDQVGNRALGERLSALVPQEAYCAASTLFLFLPMTPLMFMGQEWGATSPFLFFTDHEPELGRLIGEGRRAEFKSFRAFTDPAARAAIPDPQDEQTFARSRLRWEDLQEERHRRIRDLYRRLLHLRRTDPVLRSAGREALETEAIGTVVVVRRWNDHGQRLLLVNLAPEPAALGGHPGSLLARLGIGPNPTVLLSTHTTPPDRGALPGYAAVVLAG
jgi:maltooligosyltrehalose trehalohydrolase